MLYGHIQSILNKYRQAEGPQNMFPSVATDTFLNTLYITCQRKTKQQGKQQNIFSLK